LLCPTPFPYTTLFRSRCHPDTEPLTFSFLAGSTSVASGDPVSDRKEPGGEAVPGRLAGRTGAVWQRCFVGLCQHSRLRHDLNARSEEHTSELQSRENI